MDFEKKVPNWSAEGTEPSESLKTSGFQGGYRPPAAIFNWFWHGVSACLKEIQEKLSNVNNTADSEKSVKHAQTAGEADKVGNAMTVKLNGGSTEGTDQFTFDGSTDKSVDITPDKIGAAAADHTHSAEDLAGLGDTKTARFVVGTSANGWTDADCDYLCDGTADEVEINAAITALPSTGGEVVLLDGTYTIAAEIKLGDANVTLRGSGHGTKIVRGFDAGRMIYLSGGYGIVENLKLDGAKSTYTTSSGSYGIYALSSHNTVRDCSVTNCAGYGIYFAASKNKAVGNIVTACDTGIQANDELCIISSNICNENASYGISLQDNHIVVNGNIAKLNGSSNFYMFYSLNCTVTGNDFSVMDGDSVTPKAIYLYGSYSDDNIVTNNQVGIGAVTVGGGSGNIVGNPGYTYGTTDLTAGSSELTTGQLYFVYE